MMLGNLDEFRENKILTAEMSIAEGSPPHRVKWVM